MKVGDLIARLRELPEDHEVQPARTGNSLKVREGGEDWWRTGHRFGYLMFDTGEFRWYTNK